MQEMIRLKELLKIIPISRASVWRLARAGKFPRPIRLTERCTAWKRADVDSWLAEREQAAG